MGDPNTISLTLNETNNTNNLIKGYFLSGMHYDEILAFLYLQHGINISSSTLKRKLRFMRLARKKNYSALKTIIDFVEKEIETSGQLCGYRWIHQRCIQAGLVVTQATIRIILQEIDPVGVEYRKRKRLRRRKYVTKGPNYTWHMDAYDKLKPYGIAISGCIDGFSRQILWLTAGRTANNPKVIGGYYINTVKKLEGSPRRMRFDCGTENVMVEKFQQILREVPADESDMMFGDKSFLYGTSQNNQRIEAWWSMLRKHSAQFWINLFEELKDNGQYSGSQLEKSVIQFCFLKIIQEELDQIVYEWNTHSISGSRNAVSPRGRPVIMFELPELYHSRDFICRTDKITVEACEMECLFFNFPCDSDIYELCTIILTEKNLHLPKDPFSAVELYLRLRTTLNAEYDIY